MCFCRDKESKRVVDLGLSSVKPERAVGPRLSGLSKHAVGMGQALLFIMV